MPNKEIEIGVTGFTRFFENSFTLSAFFKSLIEQTGIAIPSSMTLSFLAGIYPTLSRYNRLVKDKPEINPISLTLKQNILYRLSILLNWLSVPGVIFQTVLGIVTIASWLGEWFSDDPETQHIASYVGDGVGVILGLFLCWMFLDFDGSQTKENVLRIINDNTELRKTLSKKELVVTCILGFFGAVSYAMLSWFYTTLGSEKFLRLFDNPSVTHVISNAMGDLSLGAAFGSRIISTGLTALNNVKNLPDIVNCFKQQFTERPFKNSQLIVALFFFMLCQGLEYWVSSVYMMLAKTHTTSLSQFALPLRITLISLILFSCACGLFLSTMKYREGIVTSSALKAYQREAAIRTHSSRLSSVTEEQEEEEEDALTPLLPDKRGSACC